MNEPNDEFEKLIAPFEVMAGGLYSKKCVKVVAQWAFAKAVTTAKEDMVFGKLPYPEHRRSWDKGVDETRESIIKAIQQYA